MTHLFFFFFVFCIKSLGVYSFCFCGLLSYFYLNNLHSKAFASQTPSGSTQILFILTKCDFDSIEGLCC